MFSGWTATGVTLTTAQQTNPNLTFTMPAANVTLTANFTPAPPTTYTITTNATNGTVTGVPATASAGSSINATAAPNTGFVFAGWTATGVTLTTSQQTNPNLTFIMPAGNVTLTANFTPAPPTTYTITTSATNGTISGLPATASAGSSINATAAPNTGFMFAGWTATGITLTTAQQTNPNLTFIMPNNNITLTANFSILPAGTYNIIVSSGIGGVAKANVSSATLGQNIILTASPNTGYRFKNWNIISGGIFLTNTATTTFNMPNNPVIIQAEFELIPPPTTTTTTGNGIGANTANGFNVSNNSNNSNFTVKTPIKNSGFNTITDTSDSSSANNSTTSNNTNKQNTDLFVITKNGSTIKHNIKQYKNYINISPQSINESQVHQLAIQAQTAAKLPIRFSLQNISAEITAKDYQTQNVTLEIKKTQNQKALKASGNITKSDNNDTLWEVSLTPNIKTTLRISLDKKYQKKDIMVYKYVPSKNKFFPVKNSKWAVVKAGNQYSVRIENVNDGIYTVIKK